MNDDEIIQRLRSALDEVAAAPAVESTVETPDVRESFGLNRWIAVAAAVLLIGLGSVVLVQRHGSTNDDKAGPAPTATTAPTTAPTTTPPSTTNTPQSTIPGAPTGWYTLTLGDFTASTQVFDYCCKPWPAPGPDLSMAWGDVHGIDHGLLILRVHRSATSGAPTLTYAKTGMTEERMVALEKQVVEGSGLPYVLPDPSMQLLGNGLVGDGTLVSQTWSSGGNVVALAVGDYRFQLEPLTQNPTWTTTKVAGSTAYRIDDDMGATFIWQTPVGTWATLHIAIGLAKRVDEILAALKPSAATAGQRVPSEILQGVGVTIIDKGKGPMIAFSLDDSLPPGGGDVPLAGFDWSMVNDERTTAGTTWVSGYTVVGKWDGFRFTLTEPPTRNLPDGRGTVPTHDKETPGCTLEMMAPMLDALGKLDYRSLGIILSGSYNWDGHCGVEVRALFDTPAVRDAMAKVGNDVTLTFAFVPVTTP